ncbi:RagB/SusD family nutrient uptake outer membrane protein [Pedobacter frigidisoli]|uniref:RagB/SusD family nutrient uptake outer membrane protein n=1 Tax=Pedobacter frigidisoli TaxID=2530455 RepID=A0A4R0NMC2_9SPHI|nr:RagB/SusD family nutrient uptake outer membrane protein [Pedobacter frigidisoli]TCD00733.1 RagB/SusD family nutrient uptake outer membrane protein [Pedobacter frigidisoli]
MKTKLIILVLFCLVTLSSCKKWLDVQPKTQVESSANFETVNGFKDALTGVYVNMTTPALYGKELSFGFVDVIGKNYTQFRSSHDYYQDAQYNYLAANTRARIDNIWMGSYNTIANINNLIANLNTVDKGMFTGSDYQIIRGEAYGLRAFNHFDLLRLFAPSPAAAGLAAKAIPYRTEFKPDNVVQSTVGQVLDQIIADLQVASDMLRPVDPIVAGSTVVVPIGGYLRDRPYKFNYYAVRALLARVYLYKGDKANALICAKEVIASAKFPFTIVSQIIGGNGIFSTEVIFNLNINTLQAANDIAFSETAPVGMYFTSSEWSSLYEISSGGSADYRYVYTTKDIGDFRYTQKINPVKNTLPIAANRLPLIRMSEMYYIAAESSLDTDPSAAIGYMNTIRTSRNLANLAANLTPAAVQTEILKEYRKDFLCEGQLFYYYKRLNLPSITFTQVVADNKVYVLPVPDSEKEFGNIQ